MEWKNGSAVAFSQTEINGGFWKDKQDLVRNVTIDSVYDRFQESGRFDALNMDWEKGAPNKPHIFWESDATKWIEGAAYFLKHKRDPVLESKIDSLVQRMAETQEENGYLNVYFTVVEPEKRFQVRTEHELYCAGHLIEGAIAYAEATGKTAMLDVAKKYTDLIDRVFRMEHSAAFDTPGHQEIELALVKLYDYTGEERYLDLAAYFIDTRGTSSRDSICGFDDKSYQQSHIPVRQQETAVGHSVRALYMYSAMADLAMKKKDGKLLKACQALFQNIVEKRMYITGGVGSTERGEAFTFDYDLPEYTAYAETCASIALALFCRRMWLADAKGIYADCAEQAIYNTVLAGISLSGDSFFYENPLSVYPPRNAFNETRSENLKEHLPILERVRVFDCSCCPPNVIRLVGSIADFMYSTSQDTIYAQCYMNGISKIPLADSTVVLHQETEYPYAGSVRITVKTQGSYGIALRIPAWSNTTRLFLNGEEQAFLVKNGYAVLKRDWQADDTVCLELDMEVQVIEANPNVVDLCGRAAVTRGPLVFCAEGTDHGFPLRDVRITRTACYTVTTQQVAGIEMPVIETQARIREEDGQLYRSNPLKEKSVGLRLIPYFAWSNRGINEMTTWFLLR